MALSNTPFRIAAALLISGAFLPAAKAQQQPLTAKQRAEKFGISDIRGMAYHPGPQLKGCPSTKDHNCGPDAKLPIDPKYYTSKDYALPFFEDSIQTYAPDGSKVQNLLSKYTIYYDSDFYNADFEMLWGKRRSEWRRDDLARFKAELNANFVHLYDWNTVDPKLRKHGPFLDYAQELGMHVTIPISNYTLKIMCKDEPGDWEQNVTDVFNTIYANGSKSPHRAAGVLKIFNEFDGSLCKDAAHVASVAAKWKSLEDARGVSDAQRLPIIFPVTFGIANGFPGGNVVLAFNAINNKEGLGLDFWKQRVIYATNPFNPGKDMLKWITDLPETLKGKGIPGDTPVMFTEYGINIADEAAQAAFVKEQFEKMYLPSKPANFLGACAFVNQDRFWLGASERAYALMDFNKGGGSWGGPSNLRIQRVKYQNPNAKQGELWLAYYQVDLQKPRKAYCEIGKIFKSLRSCP